MLREDLPAFSGPQAVKRQALAVWGALLGSLLLAIGVCAFQAMMTEGGETPLVPEHRWIFLAVPWVMLLSAVPVGLFARGQIFKRHWVGGKVEPLGYLKGCVVAWAAAEGSGILGAAMMFIGGTGGAGLFQPLAAALLLLLLLPNGRAMTGPEHRQVATGPRES